MLSFDPKAGLPDKKKLQKEMICKVVRKHPFPDEQCEWLFAPQEIQNKFKRIWSQLAILQEEGAWEFKVRLRKEGTGFEVREYVHEGLPGWVEAFIRWDGEQVIFGFYLIPYGSVSEDAEPGTEDFYENGCECLGIEGKEKLVKEEQFLRDVWTPAPRAKPIEAPAGARPNDPCPCGSGKKFKRCCAWKRR